MLQSIYDQMTDFYDSIEEEYATFFDNSWKILRIFTKSIECI